MQDLKTVSKPSISRLLPVALAVSAVHLAGCDQAQELVDLKSDTAILTEHRKEATQGLANSHSDEISEGRKLLALHRFKAGAPKQFLTEEGLKLLAVRDIDPVEGNNPPLSATPSFAGNLQRIRDFDNYLLRLEKFEDISSELSLPNIVGTKQEELRGFFDKGDIEAIFGHFDRTDQEVTKNLEVIDDVILTNQEKIGRQTYDHYSGLALNYVALPIASAGLAFSLLLCVGIVANPNISFR